MPTNSREFHAQFMDWAFSKGAVFFERGGNVNGKDTYVNHATQLAWELWQDVADGVVTIRPDRNSTAIQK